MTAIGFECDFVPRVLPAAGSEAAQRLVAGVKLLEVDPVANEIRIYPTDTRRWVDGFLGPRYSKLRAIILRDRLDADSDYQEIVRGWLRPDPIFDEPGDDSFEPDPDILRLQLLELMDFLPAGFTKDCEYGLGFAQECDPFLQLIEENSDCDAIELGPSSGLSIEGRTFRISYQGFEAVRAELARIKNRGDSAILRVKRAYAQNELADVLGLEATQYSPGRHPTSQLISRAAANDEPLSDADQQALLAAAATRTSPSRLIRLHREIELVNLERLIDDFGIALDARHQESWWQKFFEENVFALEMLFGGPTVLIDPQVAIGEAVGSTKGKKIADYLLMNSLTNNAALVEIKRPTTRLMNRVPYRVGVYGVHSEIGKSVVQVLDQARRLMSFEEGTRLRTSSDQWVSSAPRCFVVAGLSRELDSPEKRRSFELFREHLSGVRLVTYDEVLEQLKALRAFLLADTEP